MVFCGKSSKNCSSCRVRRIKVSNTLSKSTSFAPHHQYRHVAQERFLQIFKCDLKEPACSQCMRINKECSGYRDQLTLAFRDENSKVIRKAQTPNQQTGQQKDKSPDYSTPITLDRLAIHPPSRKRSKSPSLVARSRRSPSPRSLFPALPDDEGIRFFFDHYATAFHACTDDGSNGPDSPAIWPNPIDSPMFANTLSSVGFAGLYNVTKNENHMVVARRKYTSTLIDIKEALTDLSKRDLDETFKTVMLLALYEVSDARSVNIDNADMTSLDS